MSTPDPQNRRLGLFGGSFDPVHRGHLHAAQLAQSRFELERVVFVPAARPPHKPGRELASGADRLAMLELALCDHASWSVSDLELARAGPSFTADTVRALPGVLGEAPDVQIYLILGSDNLPGLPQWREADWLLANVQPIVVPRDGDTRADLLGQLACELAPALVARIESGWIDTPPRAGRSTSLRADARAGRLSDVDVPERVREYIVEHGLYPTP